MAVKLEKLGVKSQNNDRDVEFVSTNGIVDTNFEKNHACQLW